MNEGEQFWRNKISDEVEVAWDNLLLKTCYSNELLASMIIDFIRKGNREEL